LGLPWRSSRLLGVLGTEVDGAREGSWYRCCEALALIGAKPLPVGAVVYGLACSLHRPTVCSWQMWVQRFRIGATLSHRVLVVGDAFWGCEVPGLGYLVEC
jgi:hypothetical protein